MHVEKEDSSNYKYYPLVIIVLCSSLIFYKYILKVSPGIMASDLMRQFRATGTQLGNLAATFFYTFTIVQLFSGVLLDKLGTRFIAGFSTLIAALGAYVFSKADSLLLASVARGMMGFGVAFSTITYFKLSAAWFRIDQLAFVGGLLVTAVMTGAIFGQAPLAWMIDHTNWRFVFLLCSILGFFLAVLFLLFVRERPKSLQNSVSQKNHVVLKKAGWREIKIALKSKQNWLLTLYSGLAFSPLSVLGGLWGNPFLQEAYHLSRSEAAGFTSLLFIGLGLGGPLLGLLSDKLNNRVGVMKFFILVCLFSLLGAIYLSALSALDLGILLFTFGFSTGAFMLSFTIGTQMNPIVLAGTTVALINTGDSVFESLTDPMLGKILDLSLSWSGQSGLRNFSVHDYHLAFILLILYLVAAFVVLFLIKEPHEADKNALLSETR